MSDNNSFENNEVKISWYSDRGGFEEGFRTKEHGYRENNEDSIFVGYLPNLEKPVYVLGVFDGVGGGVSGKFASSTASSCVADVLEANADNLDLDLKSLQRSISTALAKANRIIYSNFGGSSATTATVALTDCESVYTVHMGDTRCYNLGQGFEILTRDDTWVQEMIEAGKLSVEEAERHPKRHIIKKAVGAKPQFEPVLSDKIKINKGILMTTDGFSELLSSDLVERIYSESATLENASKEMIELGQKDNISAILLKKKESI